MKSSKRTALGRPLNWKPELPHHAVRKFNRFVLSIPHSVDLRPKDTPIFDQGQEGSCTMNAGCGLSDYLHKQAGRIITGSRNFGYWVERALDGTVDQDAGSSLSRCTQVFEQKGVCLEDTWPYGPNTFLPEPPAPAWGEAWHYKIGSGHSISQDLLSMKVCLSGGQPFIFGISVYDSFESAPGGQIPMPGSGESLLGGHALCSVGYNDSTQCFIVRNSWGTDWGDNGYCYIPYAYLQSPYLASDFWTFEL